VRGNLEYLLKRRGERAGRGAGGGLPTPWIVPRITRCDATYEELENFFDRWILGAGAAVIDPLPCAVPGERIEPLPLPKPAARRMARERMVILSDGRVPVDEVDLSGDRCVGDVSKHGVMPVWRELCSRRFDAALETLPGEAELISPARAREASIARDA
jgi:hypothetical protein